MHLGDWARAKNLSDQDLAGVLGLSRVYTNRIVNGWALPRAQIIGKIVDKTDGAVTPNDLWARYMDANGLPMPRCWTSEKSACP